ncbi:MAG TPA: hypothetical protein VM599_05110 [Thermoanaerobaculia bacterium]|nr:hypothetical protein [Thermoanaerobaculia bacterium]
MSDTNLHDDQVKLVRYTIVSVERDRERKLEEDEILVTDELTPDGFASWRIAAYFQRPDHEEIGHEEKRHLRVCYRVLCRWQRESLHYQSRKLDELRGIREAIAASAPPPRPPGGRGRRPPRAGRAPEKAARAALPPVPGPDEQAVLDVLSERGGGAATGELAGGTGFGRTRIRNALDSLIAAGRVRRTGTGFGTRYEIEE